MKTRLNGNRTSNELYLAEVCFLNIIEWHLSPFDWIIVGVRLGKKGGVE